MVAKTHTAATLKNPALDSMLTDLESIPDIELIALNCVLEAFEGIRGIAL